MARLEELGGPQQIVEHHLIEALGALTPGEQAVAADAFIFLVTRSRTKVAHTASDLAEWTKRPEPEVAAVLEKLCRGESGRILRTVAAPGSETERRGTSSSTISSPSRSSTGAAATRRTGPGARRTGSSPVSEAC